MQEKELKPYEELLKLFLGGHISAEDFESRYLKLFKNDTTIWEEKIFLVLEALFSDIDAFCKDVELRDENDLDEEQLRLSCENALRKLLAK